jgi:hypothetical protein
MIKKPTLLILGAGASAPYGYPTGKQLRDIILNNTLNSSVMRFYAFCGFDQSLVKQFIQSLRKSASPSIDYFLEKRKEFIEIGKFAITKALIQYENPDGLHIVDNWYQYLFNKLTENTTFDQFDKNNLKIITFNYDRSLEFFLVDTLQNLYGKSEKECWEKLKKIPIIHVHGQIGFLPFQEKNPIRQYFTMSDPTLVKESSKSIRIIHEEELSNDEVFNVAYKLLVESEKICFLGFGYHSINLQRLKINTILIEGREILGTSHGFTTKEKKAIESLSKDRISLFPNGYNNYLILDFLRECVSFE